MGKNDNARGYSEEDTHGLQTHLGEVSKLAGDYSSEGLYTHQYV